MKISRAEAYKAARPAQISYEIAQYGEGYAPRSKSLSRSIMAQSMYRIQSTDESKAASYALYHITIGDDGAGISLRNAKLSS